jgi:hypothetical protein
MERSSSAFVMSLLLVATATLFPVVTASRGGELHLVVGVGNSSLEDFIFNLLLFVPLGVSAAATFPIRISARARSIGIVVGAAAFSYVLEVTQTLLPGRFPSLLDVAANTLGAIAGIAGFHLWRAGRSGLLLASTVAAVFVMSLLLVQAARLNWNADYPLVIGNEQTGDRPWTGRLWYVAIMDRAMLGDDLGRLMTGPPTVQLAKSGAGRGKLLALYDWTAPSGCVDVTRHLGALISSDASPCAADGDGIRVGGDRWLRAAGSAASVSTAIRDTGQFTLVARIASSSAHQEGPARIVSISASPDLRNLTLAQDNTDLVVRVRTPLTGVNGVRVPLIATDVVVPGRAQVVAVTYDGSRLSLFVDRAEPVSVVEFGPGLALAAQIVPPNVFSKVVRVVPIEKVYAWIVFCGLGFTAAWLLSDRSGAPLSGHYPLLLAGLVSTPLVLEMLLHLTTGGRLDWARVALGVTSLLAAAAGFRFAFRRRSVPFMPQQRELNCL